MRVRSVRATWIPNCNWDPIWWWWFMTIVDVYDDKNDGDHDWPYILIFVIMMMKITLWWFQQQWWWLDHHNSWLWWSSSFWSLFWSFQQWSSWLLFCRNFCPCIPLPLQVFLQVLCSQDHFTAGHDQIEAGGDRFLRFCLKYTYL